MDNNSKKDEELVALALKNHGNFGILVERYQTKLSRYIYRLCGCNNQDVEDLLQEIFIKIFRNLNDFDLSLKFSSWVYRIAHNEVISHYRKIKSKPLHVELIPELKIIDNKSDEFIVTLDSKLNKPKIAAILDKMDVKYREILVLRYFEELEYAEISDIIKKPMGTVATLLNRAKKQFKNKAKIMGIDF